MYWISNVMCVFCLTALAVKETLKMSGKKSASAERSNAFIFKIQSRKTSKCSSVNVFCFKDF